MKPNTIGRYRSRVTATLDEQTLSKLAVIGELAGGQSVSASLRYTVAELFRRLGNEGLINTESVA